VANPPALSAQRAQRNQQASLNMSDTLWARLRETAASARDVALEHAAAVSALAAEQAARASEAALERAAAVSVIAAEQAGHLRERAARAGEHAAARAGELAAEAADTLTDLAQHPERRAELAGRLRAMLVSDDETVYDDVAGERDIDLAQLGITQVRVNGSVLRPRVRCSEALAACAGAAGLCERTGCLSVRRVSCA
jgi:hypothetical protein